jgi:membrane-associated protein
MSEQLLAALSQYGPPALFAIVAIAAIGMPLPISLLLIVTGSLVAQGAMSLWLVIAVASAGSVAGDQIGYALGRWGGHALARRFSRLLGSSEKLEKAEAKARAWGGPGIFFSRWLISPLGPWINLASGTASYPWIRFLFWDALGEVVGATIFVMLGRVFSDRVMALADVLGDLTWAILALLAAVILGGKLFSRLRKKSHP